MCKLWVPNSGSSEGTGGDYQWQNCLSHTSQYNQSPLHLPKELMGFKIHPFLLHCQNSGFPSPSCLLREGAASCPPSSWSCLCLNPGSAQTTQAPKRERERESHTVNAKRNGFFFKALQILQSPLKLLLTCRFWFSRSGLSSKIWHF